MQRINLNKKLDGEIELTIDGLRIENVKTAYCDGDTGIITIRLKGSFTEDKDVNIAKSAAEAKTGGERPKKA